MLIIVTQALFSAFTLEYFLHVLKEVPVPEAPYQR